MESKTEAKLVKVRFLQTVRGSYGAYNPGDIKEIPSSLAAEFLKEKAAEKK